MLISEGRGWLTDARQTRMKLFTALTAAIIALTWFGRVDGAAQQIAETAPPAKYHRQVRRAVEGDRRFALLSGGRPNFAVVAVTGPSKNADEDEMLRTAAADFSKYFAERWSQAPRVASSIGNSKESYIVLTTTLGVASLPRALRGRIPGDIPLNDQAYVIYHVPAAAGGAATLVCVGGSAIAARYASVDILRRMTVAGGADAFVAFDRLTDEPYSTWRAVYINDSAHQLNNYSPNLIYDVETYRWPIEKWRRYVDQMAFQRYNVLQIWLVPNMFSPDVLKGGGVHEYVRDTLRAVGRYAKPRGITLSLISPINVAVKTGTRLDSLPIPVYKSLPVYTYLSPNKPDEKELNLRLWDYWSKAVPEAGIWQLFPGDPGGCHEEKCGPETYVDLALEVTRVIKKNNPRAVIDFTPWQFFGWGPSWVTELRKDTARVDRGYRYLMSKLGEFPPDTIFSPNLNDYTSEPGVKGAGFGGGSSAKYIEEISKKFLVHTWTYFVTEGEGWINHHYKVPTIIKQRDVEARYPISGGLCYTMTPSFNILNQFACAESFWDPTVSGDAVMRRYAEGIFGTADPELLSIFPLFDVAPMVGYTFADSPDWQPDYQKILDNMRRSRRVLQTLKLPDKPREVTLPTPAEYAAELIYFCNLYEEACQLGMKVSEARAIVRRQPSMSAKRASDITARDAQDALNNLSAEDRAKLRRLLGEIRMLDVAKMKERFRAKHYQIFVDHPTEFTPLLPKLIDGFFNAFGANFLDELGAGERAQ